MDHNKPVGPPKPKGPKTLDLRKEPTDYTAQVSPTRQPATEPAKASTVVPKPKKRKGRWKKILALVLSLILIVGGLYILFILLIPNVSKPSEKSVRSSAEVVVKDKNQVFVPSVGIQSEIKEGGIDILDQGVVWHRLPERGNPEKGGNFILTGHSFVWGYTPQEVTKQSVFYHLSEAKVGDEILVHWNNKKYTYTVKEKQTVKPNATEVEKMSDKPKLTMYTCTTGGASDGRVVIVAEPTT